MFLPVSGQASLIVKSDDQFAYHRAPREGNDPLISLQARVDKNARREALMHRANIPNRRPNVLRGDLNHYFLVDGSHGS
jgi:hypothetical protein